MPRKRNSEPPKAMTWAKAAPALAIAAIFDALRLMFNMFWFFGPALAALYCTTKVGGWVGMLGGLTPTACVAAGGVISYFGAPVIVAFGVIMAMAVGFAGWLVIGGWLMATNSRIFKENALWFVGSLLFSEIPIIGAIPAITVAVWRMYSHQIKIEKAAYKKWEKEQAGAQQQMRNQQMAQLMQAQAMQQQAANDELYAQQAANEEIPEEERKAA